MDPSNAQQKNDRPIVNQIKQNFKDVNSNTSKKKIKIPSDTVVTLIDDSVSEMIPLPAVSLNKESGIEQDPLYISGKSSAGKTNGYYSRVMTYYSRKNLPVPKLPPSTTVFIEDEAPKRGNQKENGEMIRTPRLSNASITIDDEDRDRNKTKMTKTVLTENKSAVNKRKRNPFSRETVIKKKKIKFNNATSSINLDDDAETADTTSESGSLSNEIIQTLGRSGITVHKLMKDCNRSDDVITLD